MSNNKTFKIIYTQVDESPALATYSFLPIVQAFTKGADIQINKKFLSDGNTKIFVRTIDFESISEMNYIETMKNRIPENGK